jgi:cytochrome c-type protein NapB
MSGGSMRHRVKLPTLAAITLALVAGRSDSGAGRAPATARPAAARTVAAIPDSTLGLSRTSVFSAPAPAAVVPNTLDPGEAPRIPRAYPGAPPRIPHAIADFAHITREENPCLGCHDAAAAAQSGAVPIPASHYRDLRRAPKVARQQVAGARYVCVSCHVPITDAKPPVENRFGPSPRRLP